MQHKKRLYKSLIALLVAVSIIILSLVDALGSAGSFILPEEKTEAVALVDDAAIGLAFSALATLGITIVSVDQIIDLCQENSWEVLWSEYKEGWSDIYDELFAEGDSIALSDATAKRIVTAAAETLQAQLGGKNSYVKGRNAAGFLAEKLPYPYIAFSGAGYADSLKGVEKFVYGIRNNNYVYVNSIPDNIVGIVAGSPSSGAAFSYVTIDGQVISASSYHTAFGGYGTEWFVDRASSSDETSYISSRCQVNSGSYNCWLYGHTLAIPSSENLPYSLIYTSNYTTFNFNIVGMPVWESLEAYTNGEEARESYPGYGIQVDLIDLTDQDVDVGDDMVFSADAVRSITDAGQTAYEIAMEAGASAEEAEEDRIAALSKALADAVTEANNSLNASNNTIIGLLKSILEALTFGSLFTLVSEIAANLAKLVKSILDGSVFESIINAILSIPDALAKALSNTLEWLKDIPQSIADTISSALEWIMDIPQTLADAISVGLEWLVTLPGTIADAISSLLEGLLVMLGIDAIVSWLTLDTTAVTSALSELKAALLDKLGFPFLSNPFDIYADAHVYYPVIRFPLPKILKQFMNLDEIVIVDFSDYASYCHEVRTILQGFLWFSFAIWIMKNHKVQMSLS